MNNNHNHKWPKTPTESPHYYDWIAVVIFSSFIICSACLLFLNTTYVTIYLEGYFGSKKTFLIQLFFWACFRGVVTCYKFFRDDKDRNELENVKAYPDPVELRWPNSQDVVLYSMRILISGGLGILGSATLLAGLGVFESLQNQWGTREKTGLIVFCFIVGMFQEDFLGFIMGIKDQFFKRKHEQESSPKQDNIEDLSELKNLISELTQKDDIKTKALTWIAKEFPPDKLGDAYKDIDYSKDVAVFIKNPPGNDAKEILFRLLVAVSKPIQL